MIDSRVVLTLGASLALGGCSLVNGTDACETRAAELRVNERGDDLEHIGSSRGAALLDDGRLLVAHVSSTEDGARSEVRVALLEPKTHVRNILCGRDDRERVVSDPETISFRASVAAVDIPDAANPLGHPAVAAVGWTSLADASGDPNVSIQLIDASGCGVGTAFPPVPPDSIAAPRGLALAWSPVRGALYAVFHDGRQILGAWIEAPGSASTFEVLGSEEQTLGDLSVAFGPDGRGLVTWELRELAWLGRGEIAIRAALIDADGRVRAAPFRVDAGRSYAWEGHEVALGVSVDASSERYALAYEASASQSEPPRTLLRVMDADDGTFVDLAGTPDADPLDVDPGSTLARGSPSVRYLDDGALLVSWESAERAGTMARLFDDDGRARFTGVACDDVPFQVGVRASLLPGSSTAVQADGELWIFHSGDAADDPVGTAALGWHLPARELAP